MSIPMNSLCFECHLRRSLERARPLGDGETATQLAKALMKLYLSSPAHCSSPELGPATAALFQQLYGQSRDPMKQEKLDSNRFIMERLEDIRCRVAAAADPLFGALQFSVLGNYLDFAALQGQVRFEELDKMLADALQMPLDQNCYAQFRQDLAAGKKLLYLTDNAGEIGFDRILAEEIHREYPHLEISFCVRGEPVHNDATVEDAAAVGIPFPVMGSGSAVGGTVIDQLSPQARQALEAADVIIAKGMGNTETMYGCGYNVYYAFLVKCRRVVEFFHKPMMTPMFLRDPICH